MIEILEVKGLKEVDEFLKTLPNEVALRMLNTALRAAGRPMIARIKSNIDGLFGESSHSTGALRDSIVQITNRRTAYAKATVIRTRRVRRRRKDAAPESNAASPAQYGRYLEYGTSKMPAKPFFNPAVRETTTVAIRSFHESLGKSIQRHCKKHGVTFQPNGGSPS